MSTVLDIAFQINISLAVLDGISEMIEKFGFIFRVFRVFRGFFI